MAVKKRKQSKAVSIVNKKRLVLAFLAFCIILFILCVRVGYVQIVKGGEYKKKAIAQQTKDEVLEAKRGEISDRNGEKLAVSTLRYSVWVTLSSVKTSKNESENMDKVGKIAEQLSEILKVPKEEIIKSLDTDTNLVKIAKYQELDVAEKIRKAKIEGISVTEETKRFYPLGDFASQLLGSVTDENIGLSGIEDYYNAELKGIDGRWTQNTDVSGNSLIYGKGKRYSAEDGDRLQLTVDEVIQGYAKMAIEKTQKDTKAKSVSCLMMNPKNGEILAMATTPGFDPNDSREPMKKDEKAFDEMSTVEQLEYLNKMWRNPLINDTYEPGSTFKLLTTAMALEEDKVDLEEKFSCNSGLNVSGTFIKCWIYPNSHGEQTLKEAVGNSCNPIFMTLAQRMGVEKFYRYLDTFGISEKTGVDYPGEAEAQIQAMNTITKVELSAMGFGQSIAVTPIQLLTAINSFGNKGIMVEPHLVDKIMDSKGKAKEKIKTKKVRQTVSVDTCDTIKEFMEYVVTDGGGTKAQIDGYRVGGKTGTAQKKSEKSYKYDKLIVSFVGMAPINDPEISILYIVDEPEGEVWGSDVAAPGAQSVMEKTLRYMRVENNK